MSTMNMITKFESHSLGTNVAPANNKLWDGYLMFNSSLTIYAVAFFKSGEMIPDVKWSKFVEVKGKVKLHDFEKFIQDLPCSRNRGLMVISLYCKRGSSKLELEGIKKVAKEYAEEEKIGLAKLLTGVDLYVCPRNDKIITILANHGFFKGRPAIQENKDSLFGFVVWRRNQINLNPVHHKSAESSRKNDPTQLLSPTQLPSESSRNNDHILIWSPIRFPSEPTHDVTNQKDGIEKDKNVSITRQQRHPNFLVSYNELIKSEDTPNILLSVSFGLETSNLDQNLKPADITVVTKQSLPTVLKSEQDCLEFDFGTSITPCHSLHKRRLDEDMKLPTQKKISVNNDSDNAFKLLPTNVVNNQASNVPYVHSMKPNFIPPIPVPQSYPSISSQFTFLGPILMRERALAHVHAKSRQSDL